MNPRCGLHSRRSKEGEEATERMNVVYGNSLQSQGSEHLRFVKPKSDNTWNYCNWQDFSPLFWWAQSLFFTQICPDLPCHGVMEVIAAYRSQIFLLPWKKRFLDSKNPICSGWWRDYNKYWDLLKLHSTALKAMFCSHWRSVVKCFIC